MTNIDPKLCKQHFSTKIFKSYLYYLKIHYPDVDPIKLCEESGLPFEYIQNEDNWVSITFERQFFGTCQKITGDKNLAYNVGLISLSKELIGGPLYFLLRNTLSLNEIYKNIPKLSSLFNKLMDVKLTKSSPMRMEFVYSYLLETLSDIELDHFKSALADINESTKGYFAGIPQIKDLPHAKIEVIDSENGFTLGVEPPFEYKLFDLASSIKAIMTSGLVFGVSSYFFTWKAALPQVILVILCVYFFRKYTLARESSNQTQTALEKVDTQFQELQKAKIDLQRKLQEATVINKVTESISKELNQKNILDRACQSLTQDLGYDRVIILLANPNTELIEYASSAGLGNDLLDLFKGFGIPMHIDSDDDRKLTNVFRFGKSILIADVKTHLATLLPESRSLLSASGSTSFICSSIETEQSKHGLIIADCYHKEKILGTADLKVLSIVGQQIAQSLERKQNRQAELNAFERANQFQEGFLHSTLQKIEAPLHQALFNNAENSEPKSTDELRKTLVDIDQIIVQIKSAKQAVKSARENVRNATPKNSSYADSSNFSKLRKGSRILLVEDQLDKQLEMTLTLQKEGYQINAFSNGKEALDSIVNGYRPELILMDVMMPIMAGYEAATSIRSILTRSDVPIVFLHNSGQTPDYEMGSKSGGCDFLDKDLAKSEFLARVRSFLESAQITRAYSRFIPWKTFELLNYKSALDVKLGDGIEAEMTVLFCDIRNFTSLCENLSPSDVLAFLNSYLSVLSPVISQNNGFIDSFIGDCIMAIFPSPQESLAAARAMIFAVYQMRTKIEFARFGTIEVGIGINTGPLILGPIGFEGRLQITSISDSVNTASRVESLCKEFGASLIITESSFEKLDSETKDSFRLLGEVNVKGRKSSTRIFEDYSVQPLEKRYTKEKAKLLFQKGVELYLSHKLELSLATFLQLGELKGDLAIEYYLDLLDPERLPNKKELKAA